MDRNSAFRLHLILVGILLCLIFGETIWLLLQEPLGVRENWQCLFVPFLSVCAAFNLRETRGPVVHAGGQILGAIVLTVGFLLHFVGVTLFASFFSRLGLVTAIEGSVLFLLGRAAFRQYIFPLLYLYLTIPPPEALIISLTAWAKLFSSHMAASVLALMGFPVVIEGTILKSPDFVLGIIDECSGLRFLTTLTVLSLAVAYLTQTRLLKKIIVVAIAPAIAIASNIARIVVTALLARKLGEAATRGTVHTLIGLGIFFSAFGALYGFGVLIGKRPPRKVE
jgi:exosortase